MDELNPDDVARMNAYRAAYAPKLFEKLIGPLREAARALGYALAVHGSIKRDIDLIAVPWTLDAAPERQLSEALYAATKKTLGFEPVRSWHVREPEFTLDGAPGIKPHGRLGWVWQLGGGVYIDLSVMPRKAERGSAE